MQINVLTLFSNLRWERKRESNYNNETFGHKSPAEIRRSMFAMYIEINMLTRVIWHYFITHDNLKTKTKNRNTNKIAKIKIGLKNINEKIERLSIDNDCNTSLNNKISPNKGLVERNLTAIGNCKISNRANHNGDKNCM